MNLGLGALESIKVGGKRIAFDQYCPTWHVIPHKGWRKFFIVSLRIPKHWFKPEVRERVMYSLGDMIVVSPETYQAIKDGTFEG